MAVTRSWESQVALSVDSLKPPVPVERRRELWWLLSSSVLIAMALFLVYSAKSHDFAETDSRLKNGAILNLHDIRDVDQIAPYLQGFPNAAEQIWLYLQKTPNVPNVGALARIRVDKGTLRRAMPKLKPLFVVRTPSGYLRQFILWIGIYFTAFYVVHLCWRVRRFQGDGSILPALHLLTGLGLALAVSIRDPLRDTLEFTKFAWGVAIGCGFLLLPLLKPFDHRKYSRMIYTPLLLAFALFAALVVAGSGPTGSDSKVNLGPLQPVEAIKVLLVFFMAGYFANKWEWLRDLREKRLLPPALRWMDLPRFRHALPVMFATACGLLIFFVLKDLGPALVTGFLFLALFGVARGRAGLAVLGIVLLVSGVFIGYKIGKPHTVVDRISMWTSPWDNDVRGGDQIAHSFWALSTGGAFGSGPGWGDPGMIPAGHTDLVMPAIGEEFGYCGVVVIALLFVFLFHRAMAIARSASDDYGFFLALGFGTLIALEMLLDLGRRLGRDAVIRCRLAVSQRRQFGDAGELLPVRRDSRNFEPPPGRVRHEAVCDSRAMAGDPAWHWPRVVLVVKAGYIQMLHDSDFIAHDTKVFQEDGVKRAAAQSRG